MSIVSPESAPDLAERRRKGNTALTFLANCDASGAPEAESSVTQNNVQLGSEAEGSVNQKPLYSKAA